MIVQNKETGEIYYSDLFVNWTEDKNFVCGNWIDHKAEMRKINKLIYENKLLIASLGINEDDYPMEWD